MGTNIEYDPNSNTFNFQNYVETQVRCGASMTLMGIILICKKY